MMLVDTEAEANLLGGIFLRNEVMRRVGTLEPDQFHDTRHQAVFMAMRNLDSASRPIDPLTVETELQRLGMLEAVGGLRFVAQLCMRVPTAARAAAYAALLGVLAKERRLLTARGCQR
jgi:replicative DNA helicase